MRTETRIAQLFFYAVLCIASGDIHAESFFDRGLVSYKKGDFESASALFIQALESGESHEWVYINLVESLRHLGKFEEAVSYAEKGFQKYPQHEQMRAEVFWAAFQAGWDFFSTDPVKAEEYAQRCYELDRSSADATNLMGLILAHSGDAEKILRGITILLQGFLDSPSHPYLGLNLFDQFRVGAEVFLQKKEYTGLLRFIDRIYDAFRLNREELPSLELSLLSLNRQIDSLFNKGNVIKPEDFDNAVVPLAQKYPQNIYVKHSLGVGYFAKGRKEEGYAIANKAFDDYEKNYTPVYADILLAVPLKRKALVAVGFNSMAGPTHFGLWRYNLDFIVVDKENRQVRPGGDFSDPKSHYTYEVEVYSPADGIVAGIDNSNMLDSYVLIRLDDRHVLNLVHFKPGSIPVSTGQRVSKGQFLGLIGEAVHLHMGVFNGDGIYVPYRLAAYRTSGGIIIRNGIPAEGDIIVPE